MDLGMVAEYEEREAAIHSGIPWLEWLEMDTLERAACVAHMRLSAMVTMHSQDAVMRDSELREARSAMQQRQRDEVA